VVFEIKSKTMYNPLIEVKHTYEVKNEISYVRALDVISIQIKKQIIETKNTKWQYVENVKEIADRVNEVEYINSYVLI